MISFNETRNSISNELGYDLYDPWHIYDHEKCELRRKREEFKDELEFEEMQQELEEIREKYRRKFKISMAKYGKLYHIDEEELKEAFGF